MISVAGSSADAETYRADLAADTARTDVGSYLRSFRVELISMVFTVR